MRGDHFKKAGQVRQFALGDQSVGRVIHLEVETRKGVVIDLGQ